MSLLLLFNQANESLLATSQRLLDDHHPAPALVVAQSAVEVAMEGAIDRRLKHSAIPEDLQTWIKDQRVRGPP